MRRVPIWSLAALLSWPLIVAPARAQPELAGHPVAPGHLAAETMPVMIPDGAGGAFVAFKAGPPIAYYATPSLYVARVDPNGGAVPGWTPVAIGSLPTQSSLPVIMAATGPGHVWLAPDFYYGGTLGDPYLVRPVGGNGLTSPDSSQAVGAEHEHNSLAAIGADRVLVASKFGSGGGSGALYLAILEPTGELVEAPAPIEIPGGWSTGSDYYRGPVMLADGAGGAWVLCEFASAPFASDIAALRIAPDGTPALSTISKVVCAAPNEQSEARLALDDANGAFIVWTDQRDLAKGPDVFASHLLADGSFAPGVPIQGRAIASLSGAQFDPQIASDGSGGAWLVWNDSRSGENDVYFTHIGPDCLPRSGFPAAGRALCAASGSQILPRIVADGEGGIYAVWLDQRDGELDLYGQHIHATGVVMPGWIDDGVPICTGTSGQASPSVCLSSPHHAIATWLDTRTGYEKIYAAALPGDGPTAGVPFSGSPRLSLAPAVNPVRGGIELRVSSADDGPIRTTLVDVSGRVRAEQVIAGPARDLRVRFDAPGAGLYFMKAEQRGVLASARVAVVR